MPELIYGTREIKPPYLVRKYGVSEEEFDMLTDEDTKADLFDGVFIMCSPASIRHERMFRFFFSIMNIYVEDKQLGEVLGSRATMHLAYCRMFEPDILFVRSEKLGMLQEKQLEGAADVVVEIVSEWTRDYDLREKRPVYQEAGIGEIWFIDDEERKILIDRKSEGSYITETISSGKIESQVILGFFVIADWFWKESLPNPSLCLQKILS